MAAVPQVHPLWLAEVRDGDVHAGRVVAWQVHEEAALSTATPIAAFTSPAGLLLETSAPRGTQVCLGDTRDGAVAAAQRVASPAPDEPRRPGHPPPAADDEDDDPRPPDPRSRTLTLRRLSADEPAGPEPDPAGRITRRTAG
jgi:hypothetical protein